MTSQFDLTRFYDVIIRNSVFQLGFLTQEFQIPSQSCFKMPSSIWVNLDHVYEVLQGHFFTFLLYEKMQRGRGWLMRLQPCSITEKRNL